jgi:hypothetical protein
MHDPMTVAFDLYFPKFWTKKRNKRWHDWVFVMTIWHVDPETDGTDDSCRWFKEGRPWYKHPRWHIHHWKIQIHFIQNLKRWAWSRCAKCGGRFKWGYAPISTHWYSKGPQWFHGEDHIYHHDCDPYLARKE